MTILSKIGAIFVWEEKVLIAAELKTNVGAVKKTG
jgi:hypothetical protein